MARRTAVEDDWDDESDDDDEVTVPCPYCGKEIHEEAEALPALRELHFGRGRTAGAKAVVDHYRALLCLYVVYRWIVG